MVGAAWGCHCEKAEPPTLAAHARGALPLVGTAWGVTARKANHNASNARGVTTGKMVCVSVKYRRPKRWTDQDQIWHAYADGPGDGSYLNKFEKGVEVGILGGQKNQKSGKCYERPRKVIKNVTPTQHHPTPSDGGRQRGGG